MFGSPFSPLPSGRRVGDAKTPEEAVQIIVEKSGAFVA